MSSSEGVHDADLKNVRTVSGLKLSSYSFNAGAAQATLGATYPPVIYCDPGGGTIDLLLPAEAGSKDLCFHVFNTADAAEPIVLKEDSDTTTILTIAQNEAGFVHCDGTTWRGYLGTIT